MSSLIIVDRAGLTEIEAALDAGNLWVLIGSSRYWQCRRNGATKRWKTRPLAFRIPIKAGLKATGSIDEYTFIFPAAVAVNTAVGNRCNYVISKINPLEQAKNERAILSADA